MYYDNDDDELEKTKSLNDLTDLIAKETEDYLPKEDNDKSLEDDILNQFDDDRTKEEVYDDLITPGEVKPSEVKDDDKNKKKKKSFIDKFKALPKKNKIVILSILGVIILGIIIIVVYLILLPKNEVVEEQEEEKIVIDEENYRYVDGILHFLNENKTEIGTYECNNKDENNCYVAYLNNDKDIFNTAKSVYEDGSVVKFRSSIYSNRYVFIIDRSDSDDDAIYLYDMLENKIIDTYTDLKAYDVNDTNYLVLKNSSGKYGLYSAKSNGVTTVIDSVYDYLGVYQKDNDIRVIEKNSKGYYLADISNKLLTKAFSNEIFDYNSDKIITHSVNGYSMYSYDGNTTYVENVNFISLINNDYYGLVNNNLLYIRDYSNNKYNEVGYSLNNSDYIITNTYSSDGLLKGSNYSFKTNINGDMMTIYIKNSNEVSENGLNLLDGKTSINLKYYNSLDGVLYFYSDAEKTNLIGSYTCTNKNDNGINHCYIAKNSFADNNFKNYKSVNSDALLPIIANKYVFIFDSLDQSSTDIKFYSLKDNKVKDTFTFVSIDNGYTNEVNFMDSASNVIVKKNNKYALYNITSNGYSAVYDFNYDEMERIGNYIMVKRNNKYNIIYSKDSVSASFDNKIYDFNNNYFVTGDGNNFDLYSASGDKIAGSYKMIKLGNDIYGYVDSNNKLFISDYNNNVMNEDNGIDIGSSDSIYTLYNMYNFNKVGDKITVNIYNGNGEKINTKVIDFIEGMQD